MNESSQIYFGMPQVNYCCIYGLTGSLGGVGNIGSDPCFVNEGINNFHLSGGSPCIDSGDPERIPELSETDIDGEYRIMGLRVDMGSDEYTSAPTPILGVNPIELSFIAFENGPNPPDVNLSIRNVGYGTLNWQITSDCNWVNAEPDSGSSTGDVNQVSLSFDTSGLNWGIYDCDLSIWDSNAANSPKNVHIDLRVFRENAIDFGDAPEADTNYPTTLARDGARHTINPAVYLGSSIDEELDGQPSVWANGDDSNYLSDESGVSIQYSKLPIGLSFYVKISASVGGFLNAWIDFNIDGDWSDAGEQIFDDDPLNAGINTLIFNVPIDANVGNTYARFRFSTVGGLEPNGLAPDGEVEDYVLEQTLSGRWFDVWDDPRQCHGNADGKKTGPYWVRSPDLAILKACYPLPASYGDPCYNPAADFNRDLIVDSSDEAIYYEYTGKVEPLVPADCSGKLILHSMSGKAIVGGSQYVIKWDDLSGTCVDGNLSYSIDGGSNWFAIDPNYKNGCTCEWQVPDANSMQCMIKIVYDGHHPVQVWTFMDMTGPFTIYECQLETDSDEDGSCYIDFIDFAILAQEWLGTDLDEVSDLSQHWLYCGNPYDPLCGTGE
jgi:hypothetical protein